MLAEHRRLVRQSGNARGVRASPSMHQRLPKGLARLESEAALDRVAERLKARPDILERRHETVEHPFGSIEQWVNQARS